MISSDNLCMSCMREIGSATKCPHCGYYADSAQISPYLPVRTVIANRYMAGKLLEYNGEGATYIGWDLAEKKAVKIREFIPDSFTIRSTSNLTLQIMRGSEGLFNELRQSFEELWTKLARMKGLSALICVTDVVQDYGTSYAIYDHFEGITLRDFLLRSKTGYITWERARQLLMPILSTLGTLHSAGIIHRGISPSTLVIGIDGKIKITGFCIGQARTVRSGLQCQLFDGYAAIEQYGFSGQQNTWTDIYAFAAVLYRTLIGSDPISAKERMSNDRLMVPGKFAEALPAYVINGLINALQIQPQDRTKTVEQLRAELSASPSAAAASSQYNRPPMRPAAPTPPAPPSAPPAAPAPSRAPAVSRKPAKNKKARAMSNLSVGLLTACICVIIGLLPITIFMLTDDGTAQKGGTSVTDETSKLLEVGNYEGKNYEEFIGTNSHTEKFTFKFERIPSDSVPKDFVISQSIEPGEMLEQGGEIILYVSSGEEMIILEAAGDMVLVIGLTYEDAEEKLTDAGFVVKKVIVKEGYAAPQAGEVVKVSLAPGSYPRGQEITLMVYEPDDVEGVTDEDGNIIEGEDTSDENASDEPTEDTGADEPETEANAEPDVPAEE